MHPHLSQEILDEIAFQLAKLESSSGELQGELREKNKDYPKNDEYPPLKSLRLVNKAWSISATFLLFRTVVLYLHSERWEALNRVCNSPRLAKYVQCIQIAELAPLHSLITS